MRGSKPDRRLVEEQDLRVRQQRTRDLEASALAAAVGADRSVDEVGEPERLAELADASVSGLVIETPQTGVHGEVPPSGQRAVDGRLLEDDRADAAGLARMRRDVEPGHVRDARGRDDRRREHPDGRRLARAVGSEEAEDLAGSDVEVDVTHRLDSARVDLGQASCCDRVHARQDARLRAGVTWRRSPRGMSHFGGLRRPLMSMEDPSAEISAAWRDHRRHVLDIAFRMMGNLAEAEDVVQEAFSRLVVADVDAIDDVGGWLVVVTTRLCLDRLRSQQRHHVVLDPSIGEGSGAATADPADRTTLDDQIRIALHVMLERLSPAERTAFVLHDVFQYPFDAIGDIVGRSPAACRQLASRARRTIADERGRSRFVVESSEQRRVVERFITACSVGDIKGLLEVLDPDVAGEGDLGGGRRRVSVGRDVIAPQIMVFLGPDSNASLVPLHTGDEAHVVALRDGHVVSVVTLTVEDERVVHIHALADPVKLGPIADVLGG